MNEPIPPELIEEGRRGREPQPQIPIDPPPADEPPVDSPAEEPPRTIDPFMRRTQQRWFDLDEP